MENNYIEIGKIVNSFGIKGELKISSESDFIEYRFGVGKNIYYKVTNTFIPLKVSSMRIHKGSVIITVNDLYDINKINQFIGLTLYALKDDTPPLKENEYYLDDLIGLEVYDINNNYIGTVEDIIKIPANDILEVKTKNKKVLIPFVKAYTKEVTNKHIITSYPQEEI